MKNRILNPGDPVICEPFKWENNPEKDSPSFVGMWMGSRRVEWNPSEYNVLGPNGLVWLWSLRIRISRLPFFVCFSLSLSLR